MNNDLEKIKLKDRQLERKRRARRRKERARRRFYFVVTIIVLLIFSFTLRKRPSRVAKNLESNSDYVATFLKINMRENQLNPINFNIKKDDVKALSYIAEVRASRIKKKLVPGENHITTAAKYAYDTKWVRDVTTGKVSYEGNKKLVFSEAKKYPRRKFRIPCVEISRRTYVLGQYRRRRLSSSKQKNNLDRLELSIRRC